MLYCITIKSNIFYSFSVPITPPQNITATNSGSTSIVISFGQIPIEYRQGVIIGYMVKIRKSNDVWMAFNTDSLSIEVKNLEKWTLYEYKIAGLTSIGIGAYSVLNDVRTDEDGEILN